ncbi:universal stress protein [Desulfobacter curvatus]|uniref:universal stress protein n=1 Tax=Desulfobacter curvatus TaxID=2290 RepID=UPI0003687706|nr:universal stress protein [Desulfobacter curvatus]
MAQVTHEINTVLAAVDFGEETGHILSWSAAICRMAGAKLAVIHVISRREVETFRNAMNAKDSREFDPSVFFPREVRRRRIRMEVLFKRLDLEIDRISAIVDFGSPVKVILKAVTSEKADLLVFGAKDNGNVGKFLFGSVAEKLFRHCPIPVMSLRPRLLSSGTKAFSEALAPGFNQKESILVTEFNKKRLHVHVQQSV